jgi:hypothetical protein
MLHAGWQWLRLAAHLCHQKFQCACQLPWYVCDANSERDTTTCVCGGLSYAQRCFSWQSTHWRLARSLQLHFRTLPCHLHAMPPMCLSTTLRMSRHILCPLPVQWPAPGVQQCAPEPAHHGVPLQPPTGHTPRCHRPLQRPGALHGWG